MAQEINSQKRSRVCPKCGSKRSKLAGLATAKPLDDSPWSRKMADVGFKIQDRICKDCGTQYMPELPAIVPYCLIVAGVVLTPFGLAMGVMGTPVIIVGLTIVAGGVFWARKKHKKE